MKAKWKFILEGESGDASEVKWLFLVLAVIILILILLGFNPEIVVHLLSITSGTPH